MTSESSCQIQFLIQTDFNNLTEKDKTVSAK